MPSPSLQEVRAFLGRRPTTIAAIGSLTGDGGALQLKVLRDPDTTSRYPPAGRPHQPDAPALYVQAKVLGRWVRVETSHPPVFYIPAADVRTDRLRPSARRLTVCEFKGTARYYDAGDRPVQGRAGHDGLVRGRR
jgi:hypothetical protein